MTSFTNLSGSSISYGNSTYKPSTGSYDDKGKGINSNLYNSSYSKSNTASGYLGSQYKPEQSNADQYSRINNLYPEYKNIKKLPQESSSMRVTFDGRSNNRIKDLIAKYDQDDTSGYEKSSYSSKSGLDKQKYRNRELEDKLIKYSETYNIAKNQLDNSTKMSQQIERLKQLRNKRQKQAKQKQQKQYPLSSSYSSSNLTSSTYRNNAPPLTSLNYDKYNSYKTTNYDTKEKQTIKDEANNFKKKKNYEFDQPYTPKYQKKIYTDYSSPIDKYKTKEKDYGDKVFSKYEHQNYTSTTSNTLAATSYTSNSTPSTYTSSSVLTKNVSSPVSKKKSQSFQYIQVNNFVLGKSLGEGKFGIVYQATHKPTGWLFAIKKVPKQMIKSHYMIDQFILEIKLQSYLYHENILSLFSCFDDKNAIYIVLQYMQEGTLFTHLKKKKTLPEPEVAMKIKQIASAVKYLHQNQIAHRDIKPQNIVMSHGVCKLCDFGWATICQDRRKTYCGTFDYAPPQILEGVQYDYTVDLWCLGVLTYELLVGKAPFYHISRKQTMKKILNVQFTTIQYPDTLSKTAVSFIDSLLKKDPKQRLASQKLLEHPFLKNADKIPNKN